MSVGESFPLEVTNVADSDDTSGTPTKEVYLFDPETDRHFRITFKKVESIDAGLSLRTDAKYDGPYWELNGYGGSGGDRKALFAAIGQAVRHLARYHNVHVHERPYNRSVEKPEPDYSTAASSTGKRIHIYATGDDTSLCGNVDMSLWARPMTDDFDPEKYNVCKTCAINYKRREDA